MPNFPLGFYQASETNLHRNSRLPRAQGLSLALHASAILLLLIPALAPFNLRPATPTVRLIFPELKVLDEPKLHWMQAHGGGGGGNQQPEPATAGDVLRMQWMQIAPPRLNPDHAALEVQATIVGPPDAPAPQIRLEIGDPFQTRFSNSQGPGRGDGIGDGNGKGQGPGDGDGVGDGDDWGRGSGKPRVGGRHGTSMPVCSYCPNPTFSDEAIKVKVQGNVTLRLVVTEDGKATNISVLRTVGYGLDERAIAAVKMWSFAPARDRFGRIVAAWVTVEVSFHQF